MSSFSGLRMYKWRAPSTIASNSSMLKSGYCNRKKTMKFQKHQPTLDSRGESKTNTFVEMYDLWSSLDGNTWSCNNLDFVTNFLYIKYLSHNFCLINKKLDSAGTGMHIFIFWENKRKLINKKLCIFFLMILSNPKQFYFCTDYIVYFF